MPAIILPEIPDERILTLGGRQILLDRQKSAAVDAGNSGPLIGAQTDIRALGGVRIVVILKDQPESVLALPELNISRAARDRADHAGLPSRIRRSRLQLRAGEDAPAVNLASLRSFCRGGEGERRQGKHRDRYDDKKSFDRSFHRLQE